MAEREPHAADVREALLAAARERLRAHLADEAADAGDSTAVAEVQAFLERGRPSTNTD
jgi:hypothetical protein